MKTIFSAIVIGDIDMTHPELNNKRDTFKHCHALFKGYFQHNIFEDEYSVIYAFMQEYKIPVFTSEQIGVLMDQNVDVILNSEGIDFDAILSTIPGLKERAAEIDKFEIFRSKVIDLVKELSNEVVTIEEFRSACEMYKSMYIHDLTEKMINTMYLINSEGRKVKGFDGRIKNYPRGLVGVKQYYNDIMEIIDKLQDSTATEHGKVDEEWLSQELEQEEKGDELKLIGFGLPEVESSWGIFRRTQMLNILGPPKGAKTRTCVFEVDNFLEAGYNVTIWPLEGHRSEWEAMIVSSIIRRATGIAVNSDKVIDKSYSEEERQLVISAKTDLAIGATRGRLSFISGGANVEDFIDVIKKHYEDVNAFDVIVIDGIVLMGSLKNKGKVERISDGFNKFQNFLKHGLPVPAFGIVSTQLKQDVVDFLRKNPDETIDVTAGGESAETIRTPDYVLGVFSSKAERDAGLMNMYSVAARHTDAFNDFTARCELGCCWYESDPDLNN